MRVVVTGGAGFIGAHTVRALLAAPAVTGVVVVDDLSTGRQANLDRLERVEVLTGSVLDGALLDRALHGADAVIHLAARPSVARSLESPTASHEVNATGTLLVCEAARRAGGLHTVITSSSSVYGDSLVLPKHERLPPAPRSPYAASKLAAEAYTLSYAASFGLPVLALRLFNVFGPLQHAGHAYAACIPAFVSAALAGRPLTVHGDGGQTRDFTYVGGVAEVLVEAVVRKVTSPEPVNVAFGSRRSLREVIAVLSELLGRPLAIQREAARGGDVRDSQAAHDALDRLFPQVVPVPFAEGLSATVEWARSGRLSADPRLATVG